VDDVDFANDKADKEKDNIISHRRFLAERMPKGNAGECIYCGEYFERIVHGACARCRDRYEGY